MLTQQQVLDFVKSNGSNCLDGRDLNRLSDFFPISQWSNLGLKVNPEYDQSKFVQQEWNKENILKQLERDVSFGFEKALNKRGISAGLMYEVVKMWMWILEDDLQKHDKYAMYGLPLFKKVAVKYGFTDEIKGFNGDESHFNETYD